MRLLSIDDFFSIPFLLMLYTVIVALLTLSLLLTGNCAKQVKLSDHYLAGEIFNVERLLYSMLIIVLFLFTTYILSPLVCIILDWMQLLSINVSVGWVYGSSYLMVSMLMLFMLAGFYQVNKIHRSLKHETKVSNFIPKTRRRNN